MKLWSFFPNWSSRYRETYSHLTEIITSDAGREQRRAWRSTARRTVSYSAQVHGHRFQAMRRSLAHQDELFEFPSERERAYTTAEVGAGSTVTPMTKPLPAWMAVGRRVVFEDRATREREVRTVVSTTGTNPTFTATGRDWSDGTRVMPARQGYLSQRIRMSTPTGNVGVAPVSFDVEPGTEVETVGVPVTVLNGIEVLTHRPNWSERVQVEFNDPTDWTDNQVSVRTPYVTVPFRTEVQQSEHLIRSEAELDQVLGLFLRCRGRCGEFYAPTWTDDFALLQPMIVGTNDFYVDGHAFYDAYFEDRIHSAFQLRMVDGSYRRFRILGMFKSVSGAPHTLIRTTAVTPVTINPSDVESISWLLVRRFASDEMSVEWVTDHHATIVVNIQSTENLT